MTTCSSASVNNQHYPLRTITGGENTAGLTVQTLVWLYWYHQHPRSYFCGPTTDKLKNVTLTVDIRVAMQTEITQRSSVLHCTHSAVSKASQYSQTDTGASFTTISDTQSFLLTRMNICGTWSLWCYLLNACVPDNQNESKTLGVKKRQRVMFMPATRRGTTNSLILGPNQAAMTASWAKASTQCLMMNHCNVEA